MKLGIKVSLQKNSIHDLHETNPTACEVWFDIGRVHQYGSLFKVLRKKSIDVGLHFWGVLPDQTLVTIAYPNERVIRESLALIQKTIDIAAQNRFSYVNIHPGTRALVTIDLLRQQLLGVSKPVDLSQSIRQFLDCAIHLDTYARKRGIVLTIETVSRRSPKSDWYNPVSRLTPVNTYELPVAALCQAAQKGLSIANDFCHTATNVVSTHPEHLWKYLKEQTELLAPRTRLIHLGFVIPPYNGTDIHDTLSNPLLDTNHAIPNRKQMITLLKLFTNRSDVWVIPEPREDHTNNYFLAKKILEEAGVLS